MKYIVTILLSFYFLANLQAQYLKNLQGQPFSDEVLGSTLYTTDGKSSTFAKVLDTQKGNIILVDFWASWCGTCIKEMEFTRKLQKEYKGKKVTFMFLSTDVDYKKWIRGLATINMEGVHYRIDEASKPAIKEFLKIRGIPYYVLLDKEGQIYDPKAPWPHQEKLKNSIDLLLELK
ncbi:MAG: TlpA disulfide reductase family protein [Bacteroidales bacterium]|nr:TlpA disulfide reductase family protein [Bacteroidales bacterium]